MLRAVLILLLVLALLAWALGSSGEKEYLFLFWLPAAWTAALLFAMSRRARLFSAAAGVIALVSLYKCLHQDLTDSVLVLAAPLILVGFLIVRIRAIFDGEAELARSMRDRSTHSLELLEERYRQEEGKIRELTERVDYIIHLFETAKNFNLCLTIEDLLGTLRDSVFTLLPCQQLRMIVFPTELAAGRMRSYEIRGGEVREWLSGPLEPADLRALEKVQEIQRFDAGETAGMPEVLLSEMAGISFPLWIFPLKSESETLALVILEGVQEKDFYPYQIVAGQLALEVQKTLLYERVQELALYDGLTQVFVRRHLEERFEEELRRSHQHGLKMSVLMLDLDHFKLYNDRFGHLIGDRVLREIADLLRSKIRSIDLIGRFGGEEFILVFPEADTAGSREAAERIRSAIAKRKFHVYDETLQATVSIGLATFPDDLGGEVGKEYNPAWRGALIELADLALYRAKEDGRNQVKAFSDRTASGPEMGGGKK